MAHLIKGFLLQLQPRASCDPIRYLYYLYHHHHHQDGLVIHDDTRSIPV